MCLCLTTPFLPPSFGPSLPPSLPPSPRHQKQDAIQPEERGELHDGCQSPVTESRVAVGACGGDEAREGGREGRKEA